MSTSPEPYRLYTAKVGDTVTVTLASGNTHEMMVSQVHAPGSAGRSFSAGPHVVAHIRPGGYSINLDSPGVSAVAWRREEPEHTEHDTVASILECTHPECIELLTPTPETQAAFDMIDAAKLLIGESAQDNPEYARAMIELITDTTHFAREDIATMLGVIE